MFMFNSASAIVSVAASCSRAVSGAACNTTGVAARATAGVVGVVTISATIVFTFTITYGFVLIVISFANENDCKNNGNYRNEGDNYTDNIELFFLDDVQTEFFSSFNFSFLPSS